MNKKLIVPLLALAFLLAGLIAGYAYQNFSSQASILFTLGDYSELFTTEEPEILIYTLPECSFSQELKKFLEHHRVIFQERVVSESPEYLHQVKSLSSQRVPVLITKNFKVEGFQKEQMSETLFEQGYLSNDR